MFNLDEEQASLKSLATNDTCGNFSHTNSLEEVRSEHLNLQKVRMTPCILASKHKNRWTD